MKIAISATTGNIEATVDPRFGRAAWLLIFDTESKELVEAVDNSAALDAAHGAGISAAALVADKGVQAVLTGRVGPKAMAVLDRAGVQAVNDVSGRVLDVVNNFSEPSPQTAPTGENQPGTPGRPGGGQCRGGGGGKGKGKGMGQGQGRGQGLGPCRR
ncbi:MAG: NifB/NifX family molybdenum-iron cluster-binding protein [Thermodesulfobacteriota bacterium]